MPVRSRPGSVSAACSLLAALAAAALSSSLGAQARTATVERSPARAPAAVSARTEILWDTWGVPHIYGSDGEGLLRAFGWAQAQSHGDLLLRLYGEARGRAAEYWGEGNTAFGGNVASDRWVRTMGIPTRAVQWHRAQAPAVRRYLDAFAAGINAYVRAHPDKIADSEEVVLPVTGADVLAHLQRVIHGEFLARPPAIAADTQRWHAAGSNAWAIAPSRTASGRAMLVANPHLPWSGYFTFYEAQLTAPGIDAYGTTLVGFPFLAIAFNDHLGWSHTVNTLDGRDLYELTLVDGGYRWDGAVRPFETTAETLKVKKADGSVRAEPLLIRRSVHGPVIAEKPGKAVALRVVGLDQPGLLGQTWDMLRATNLAQFEAAVARLQQPMFNVIYADRDGHVLYVFNGRTPVRPRGDWAFWSGIVRGDTSALLWTRTHPYNELPRVLDPPSGWVQNANDPPWYATFPLALEPGAFPPYMAPRGMALRPQRSVELLNTDRKLSFDDVVRMKHDTHVELADRVVDDLVKAARGAVASQPSSPSRPGSASASRAAEVLAAWDRTTDAGSKGGPLFAEWAREMSRRGTRMFAVPWSPDNPLTTPRGLADPAGAVAALEAAAGKIEGAFGALDVPWGDVYRLRRDSLDLPANGFNEVFRSTWYEPDGKHFRATGGDSWYAVVEFGTPVRAMALIGYGNASQPGSPHRTDQLALFSRKALRPVWRTRAEVEANLKARERF